MSSNKDRDYAPKPVTDTDKPAGGPANRDPITKAPGAHPVGTGLGATGGGIAGAAVGALGGPVGIAVGAVVGAVAGGLAGKGVAEAVDPTVEDAYWEKTYRSRPYYSSTTEYKNYRPAYRYGWDGASRYAGKPFSEVEAQLARDWHDRRADSTLEWNDAKPAVRDAWDRISQR